MCVRVVVIVKRCTLPTLGKTLNTSALYILVSESTVEYWMEQRFTWRRDRAWSPSIVGIGQSPIINRSLTAASAGNSPMGTHLKPQEKKPCPFPAEDRYSSGWPGVISCTCYKQRQKSPHWAWSKERNSHIRWYACPRLCSSLSLGKGALQAQGPSLCGWVGSLKISLETAFPKRNVYCNDSIRLTLKSGISGSKNMDI